MEDERHGIGPNGLITFDDQTSLNNNNNNNTPLTIHNKYTTNVSNNTNNNQTQDRFESQSNNNNNNNNSNKEHDRFLPIANVGRIMKKIIPGNGKISKDAKETVQECVSEFISFVTGEASDKCQREKRKTINGDDIIWAITTLGFEDYVMPLKQYLNRYREFEGEKLNVPKRQRLYSHSNSLGDQNQDVASYPNHLYSSSPFVSADEPLISMPFAQSLVQQQLQSNDQFDSIQQG